MAVVHLASSIWGPWYCARWLNACLVLYIWDKLTTFKLALTRWWRRLFHWDDVEEGTSQILGERDSNLPHHSNDEESARSSGLCTHTVVVQILLCHMLKIQLTLVDTHLDFSLWNQVDFKGQKLTLMTSHLESCRGHAGERMKQLQVVMQRMREAPNDVTVLFGGDTNLRDTEVRRSPLHHYV